MSPSEKEPLSASSLEAPSSGSDYFASEPRPNDRGIFSAAYRSHRPFLIALLVMALLLGGIGGWLLVDQANSGTANNNSSGQPAGENLRVILPVKDQVLTVNSNLKVGNDTEITGNLSVAGATQLQGDLHVAGNGVFRGTVTATNIIGNYSGDGSGLNGVNAADLNGQPAGFYQNAGNLSNGTLNNARLNSDVALTDRSNIFNESNTFAGSLTLQGGLSAQTAGFLGAVSASSLTQNGYAVCDMSGNCGSGGSGNISGSGTAGTLAMFSGANGITDSALTQSGGNLTVGGAPTSVATASLFQLGGTALVSGNDAADGGTYLGINEPGSGAGSAADFLNFENAGTSVLNVDSGGDTYIAGQVSNGGGISTYGLLTANNYIGFSSSDYGIINENTAGAPIVIQTGGGAVTLKSNGYGGLTVNPDGSTTVQQDTSSATAFQIQNASGDGILTLDTTGSGNLTVGDANNPATITMVGSATASRPAAPTKGMLYYDTSTNQLIQYSGTKWMSAPKTATEIVAASNSSQAEKDAADYVATGTSDQTAINSALTALGAGGGTVYLMEGTYYLSSEIAIPQNNITLAGSGGGTILTVPNAQNGSYIMVGNYGTAGITIENLTIDGNSANQSSGRMYGIYLGNMGSGSGATAIPGARILNTTVKNMTYEGIYLASSNNNTITGNTVTNIAGLNSAGIFFTGTSNNNTITGNTVLGTDNYGILLSGSYNTVSGNLVQSAPLGIAGGSKNTITANAVQDSLWGIDGGSDDAITGNTLIDNSYGIYLSSVSNVTATGNTVESGGDYGIYIGSSNNDTISGNTVQANAWAGIYLTASSGDDVTGNKIHDNGSTTNDEGVKLASSSTQNSITNNDITDTSCTTNCYAIDISDAGSTGNYLSGNHFTGDGTHDATINDATTSGNTYSGQQLTQNGDATFRNGTNSTTAFQVQDAAGTAVLNVDSIDQLVAVNGTTSYQTYATGASFATTSYTTGGTPDGIATADLNGDGKPDVIVANNTSGTISVYFNNGDGTYGAPTNYNVGSAPSVVATADVNGDGKPDIILGYSNNGGNYYGKVGVMLNNGNGTFGSVTTYGITGSSPYFSVTGITTADLNGDGKPDIIAADYFNSSADVYINNGNGTFTGPTDYPLSGGGGALSVATADLNGDGKQDLIVGSGSSTGKIYVFMGNGDGTFGSGTSYSVASYEESIATADVNGDGHPDIITANGNSTVSVLLNNGNGTFAAPSNYTVGTNSDSVAAADVNGDSKPDIVAANSGSSNVSVLLNNGTGTFGSATNYPVGSGPSGVTTADVNNDSKPDILVTNGSSGTFSVLVNGATLLTVEGALSSVAPNANTSGLLIQGASSQAVDYLRIQNASGSPLFEINKLGYLGVANAAPVYPIDVAGDINASGTYRIGGVSINTAGTLSNVAYLNQTQTFTGANTFKDSTNSATAFQVQNAAGAAILNIDTTANQINVSGQFNLQPVSAPAAAPTTADAGAGSLPAGTYYYVYAYATANGVTGLSAESAALTIAASHNVTVTVANSPNSLVTAKVIYRSTTSGGPYQYVGSIFDNTTTTFTDSNTSPGGYASDLNTTALLRVNGNPILIADNNSVNTAVGVYALQSNSTGAGNSALGWEALNHNSTGSNNTASGVIALGNNTTGDWNTAAGAYALQSNTTGDGNTATGGDALQYNTVGSNNTATGAGALNANTQGLDNTATGSSALGANTIGQDNTAGGYWALYSNTVGSDNTGYGLYALGGNTGGSNNTAVGFLSLQNNTNGSNNTALGYQAGDKDLNGTFSTSATVQNATAIGAYAQVQENDAIVLGSVDNPTLVGIGTTVPLNTFSVSPLDYNTGTAAQSGTTITGTGTTWTAAMVGEEMIFSNGDSETITGYTSATSLTGSASLTEGAQAYRLHHIGLQVGSNGNVGVGTASVGNLLSIGALTTAAGTFQIAVSTGGATNSGIVVQTVAGQSSGDILQAQDSTGAVLASIDYQGNLTVKSATISGTLTINGHIVTNNLSGGTTTAAVQTAAGTGATCAVVGDDTTGRIVLTSGTSGWAAGGQCVVTFADAYSAFTYPVISPAGSADTSAVKPYVTSDWSTFTINFIAPDTAQHTFIWNYFNAQ